MGSSDPSHLSLPATGLLFIIVDYLGSESNIYMYFGELLAAEWAEESFDLCQ